MTIAAGIELPEAEIADICRRHQIRELSLFGSAARGEMRPDSDIDLLVDFLPGARPGLLGVSAMMRELTARAPRGHRRQAGVVFRRYGDLLVPTAALPRLPVR